MNESKEAEDKNSNKKNKNDMNSMIYSLHRLGADVSHSENTRDNLHQLDQSSANVINKKNGNFLQFYDTEKSSPENVFYENDKIQGT